MKPTRLTALASAVAAAWAAPSMAGINFAQVTSSYYVSGASAARAVTPQIAVADCQANTITRYEYSVAPRDYNVTVCTLETTAQNPAIPAQIAGDNVAIYGRAAGGSLFGLKPILVPQPIRFINPATCPASDVSDATIQQCTGLLGTDFSAGTTPDLGITDEDPQFLGNVAAEVDTSQPDPLTVAERNVLNGVTPSGFSTQGSYQIVWSVQAGSDFPLNNISWQAWRGVMAGTMTSVGDVMRAMGQTPTAAQIAAGLKICLRTNTSGTQSGQVQQALGAQFCGEPGVLPALNETSDDGAVTGRPANYDVILNSSSGNVEACLSGVVADRSRSIGINSLENAGLANIKELQIDGVTPSVTTAAQGLYPYYHESAVNWNTAFIDNGVNIAGRSTVAERVAFRNYYVTRVGDPAAIAASGLNGILATPFNGTPNLPFNPANPVAWTTKFVGFGGSNCQEPLQVFPAAETE